jgi:threonine dehydrogenase-like Zn-dependent dehydrogenase
MGLIERRDVALTPLVTAVLGLDEWAAGFDASRDGAGVKYVLDPR